MSKPTTRRGNTSAARIKTAVCISPEAFQKLGACCLKENMTQSQIVELLINRACSPYVVSVRGQGIFPAEGHSSNSASLADGVSQEANTAA
jgi:hypothetical protein